MATARVDMLNHCSTMASSRSFFNSTLLVISRAAYISQNGLMNSTQRIKAGVDNGTLQACP